MLEEAKLRTRTLQARMKEEGIVKAVFTDESSIACAFRDHPITGSDNIRSVIPI